MQYRRLIAFSLALGAGCNGQTTEGLQPLPEDEAKKHEAPGADGTCVATRTTDDAWSSSFKTVQLGSREQVRVKLDPCSNIALGFTSYQEDSDHGHSVRLYRVFRNGATDWTAWLPTALRFDMQVDEFGNIINLSESWLTVLTASGEPHLGVPSEGHPLGGSYLRQLSGNWLIGWDRVVSLPSGRVLEGRGYWGNSRQIDRLDVAIVEDDQRLLTTINQNFDFNAGIFTGSQILVIEFPGAKVQFIHAPEDPSFYAETALLAADSQRAFLGSTYYVADPATHERIECSESVLIDIRDENWRPEPLGFCGAIEAMALVDGSLFSLWSVPVEPLDPEYHPFEAVPILMRHDLDGRETGRFELESIIGRTHQDGTGALDMAITDDGKAAIVGILNGGPWNGRFYLYPSTATVARVPLE
jgi:hypothetical protein